MDITFEMTKDSFDQLFKHEQQVVVNVLGDLHNRYRMFGIPMGVDVPYFFWSMHQNTIFLDIDCPELLAEDTSHGFVLKAVYYISNYIIKDRK